MPPVGLRGFSIFFVDSRFDLGNFVSLQMIPNKKNQTKTKNVLDRQLRLYRERLLSVASMLCTPPQGQPDPGELT